jgi:RNA polymerase sigma-70 factor (ECF subfamily)
MPFDVQGRRHLAAARTRYPDVHLDDAVFLEHLADHAGSSENPARFLAEAHGPDLFLACACAQGDRAAITELARSYSEDVRRLLMHQGYDLEQVAEVEQLLYLRLVVAEPGGRPRIASYGGQGPLRGWLRVVATHLAADEARRERKEAALDLPEVLLVPAQGVAPDPMVGPVLEAARSAFENAFSTLNRRQKRILRLHFLEEMSLERIGARYNTHRITVGRWIASARAQLLSEIRRHMVERLPIQTSDVESALRIVRSRLDLSIQRFLK